MLDDHEWNQVWSLSQANMENYAVLSTQGVDKSSAAIQLHCWVVNEYNSITSSALLHKDWYLVHYFRADDYGPECVMCSLPLRSSSAKLCVECGTARIEKG